jgi:hypothetical protein
MNNVEGDTHLFRHPAGAISVDFLTERGAGSAKSLKVIFLVIPLSV